MRGSTQPGCNVARSSQPCARADARRAQDDEFPAAPSSIGALDGKSAAELEATTVWIRGEELCASPAGAGGRAARARLFEDEASADDVCQGGLGDCWLLSAAACLATRPGALRRVFLTQQTSPRGRYTLRLWDAPARAWCHVTVSDELPCDAASRAPLFTKPHGNELWVLLLEKAFAKFVGSYARLDAGHVLWALEALTGDHVRKFVAQDGSDAWRRYDLKHLGTPGDAASRRSIGLAASDETHGGAEMFDLLRTYAAQRSVVGASSGAGADTAANAARGIVRGHAYAVLRVLEVDGVRLLQLRNPWGSFEWDGPWSDKAPEWDKFPAIRRRLRAAGSDADADADDGVFWMEYKDFVAHFRQLDVCHRSTGVNELALDMHEELGCVGPAAGCLSGCGAYWCCCGGCRALCFAVESSDTTVEAKARDALRCARDCAALCARASMMMRRLRLTPRAALPAARRVPEHHGGARQVRRGVNARVSPRPRTLRGADRVGRRHDRRAEHTAMRSRAATSRPYF